MAKKQIAIAAPGMDLADLIAERDAAGAAYAEQIKKLRDAFIRLAAVERTLANYNVAGHLALPGFFRSRTQLGDALRTLQHSEFVPAILINDWSERVVAVSDEQIESFVRT